MSAEVGELRVRLEADLALERLDAAVDVLVLLQPARRRERLSYTFIRITIYNALNSQASVQQIANCLTVTATGTHMP